MKDLEVNSISLIETPELDKVLVLILINKENAFELYNEISQHWYAHNFYKKEKIIINLVREGKQPIQIKLKEDITKYENYNWLLDKVINKISTGYFDENSEVKFFKPINLVHLI